MKTFRTITHAIASALLIASLGALTACGSDDSDEPDPSLPGDNGGSNVATARHLNSITHEHYYLYGVAENQYAATATTTYSDITYDDANRVISYAKHVKGDSKKDVNVRFTYSDATISCVHSHYSYDETFSFSTEGKRVVTELFDGSTMRYEYADGKLSLIGDPNYSNATYQWNANGSLRSFTRNKRNKAPYTTTFAYPDEPKTYKGQLILLEIPKVDPFCMEGTEYNWALQLSGFFNELSRGYLPDNVTVTENGNSQSYDLSFQQDSKGYITEIFLSASHSSETYTLKFDWE